jgi:outer membrane biosynthesis protein TonB
MNATPQRLASLLALVLLVACDGGAAGSKASSTKSAAKTDPVKTAPAKIEPAKIEPAKVEPTKVEPTPVPEPVKVEPMPEPAKVEPTPVPEPVAVEPTPVPEPGDGGSVVAEPSEPAEPTPAVSGGSTPISLGTDAEILKLVLAKDVVNRQPVDPGTSFPSGTKVNLFIESRNESEADIQLSVTWENVASGRRSPPVGVKIPVRKLNRTRAYRTLKLQGEHRAILIDESGKEIAALPFTIE